MKKRLITLLLALVLVVSLLPVGVLAEEPNPAEHRLLLTGQLWDWAAGDFSNYGGTVRGGVYLNYICSKCVEDPTHTGRHVVSVEQLRENVSKFQEKADSIGIYNVAVVGFVNIPEHDHDNKDVYSLYSSDEIEVPYGQIWYVLVELPKGAVDVKCESDETAHKTETYNLITGSTTAELTGIDEDGYLTARVTITKAPYIEKYNEKYTESKHKDAAPETTTVTMEARSVNTWNSEKNRWTYNNAQINVKCPSDGYNPVSPILAALNKTAPKLNTRDHFAYVQGSPDGTVKPAGSITRAEVAAILFRLMDADSRSLYYSTASGFRDVDSTKWYNTYVATLNNAGVITDSRTGYFRPNDAITRAELAAMLAQFAEKKSAAIYFSDVSAGYWAANAIALTANLGWINGYPDGTFGPDKTVTRAELMAMVNRATGRAPESTSALLSGMKTWKDNADTARWYYLDVQEATNSHTYTGAPTETWTSLTATPDWSQYE